MEALNVIILLKVLHLDYIYHTLKSHMLAFKFGAIVIICASISDILQASYRDKLKALKNLKCFYGVSLPL
jgi:hypothetical protein